MNSRSLLYVIALLVGVGAGAWWLTRASTPVGGRDVPSIESATPPRPGEPPPARLEIPEAAPELIAETAPVPESGDAQRELAPAPPPPDFERKYGEKHRLELEVATARLSTLLDLLQQARFDELFPKFPELLAQGRYGARVIPKGESFSTLGGGKCSQLRTSKNSAGVEEGHYLEFVTSEEPLTRDISAELAWVRARIATLDKKD